MAAKLQFASVQRFFCKGNGGVREPTVQLESLISIRISSRDPGQHNLAKQRLIGISGDPFVSSEKFETISGGDGLFTSVLGCVLNSL
jgi:hypothetical protein